MKKLIVVNSDFRASYSLLKKWKQEMTSNELRELLVKATEIAWKAHARVKDKAGAPYIGHPMRVAQRCENDAERIVAMLHDTLEDTLITADDLRRDGFTDELVAAVESVTQPRSTRRNWRRSTASVNDSLA